MKWKQVNGGSEGGERGHMKREMRKVKEQRVNGWGNARKKKERINRKNEMNG